MCSLGAKAIFHGRCRDIVDNKISLKCGCTKPCIMYYNHILRAKADGYKAGRCPVSMLLVLVQSMCH